MEIRIKEISDAQEKERISHSVLLDLPEWFGIPDSTAEYITKSQDKPFIAGFVDDEIAGFIVLNATSEDCAEIFVMGVKKKNTIAWVSAHDFVMLMKPWQKVWVSRIRKRKRSKWDATKNMTTPIGSIGVWDTRNLSASPPYGMS